MCNYWTNLVHVLTPYIPGEQPKLPNLTKLNTNENPFPPSPSVVTAIQKELASDGSALRLYPDPNAELLKATLAKRYQLTPGHIFVGNGSDEVLAHVFMALLKHDSPIFYPDISYSFYPVYCGLYGVEYKTIPLAEDFSILVADYLSGTAGGIIFPNPNAPTGRALTLTEVEQIVAANPQCVVVLDEAYVDFGAQSASVLIDRYPNLLVVQTFSKSRSLAGLRVGFALGHPDLIEALERVKNSFNSYPLDRLAIAGAVAAVEDEAYFLKTCQAVIENREKLVAELATRGFEVLPSAANFIFVRHPRHDAATLSTGLRAQSVIVRHFNQPRIEQFLRITIGSPADCQALLTALDKLL
jgi:histidinol-phosphate aminotransferase